jgi:hypothetical protein
VTKVYQITLAVLQAIILLALAGLWGLSSDLRTEIAVMKSDQKGIRRDIDRMSKAVSYSQKLIKEDMQNGRSD